MQDSANPWVQALRTLSFLRIEKAYRHWGDDIAEADTPLEAGLSWGVAFDKPGGFLDRGAPVHKQEAGLARRLGP